MCWSIEHLWGGYSWQVGQIRRLRWRLWLMFPSCCQSHSIRRFRPHGRSRGSRQGYMRPMMAVRSLVAVGRGRRSIRWLCWGQGRCTTPQLRRDCSSRACWIWGGSRCCWRSSCRRLGRRGRFQGSCMTTVGQRLKCFLLCLGPSWLNHRHRQFRGLCWLAWSHRKELRLDQLGKHPKPIWLRLWRPIKLCKDW